MEFKPNKTEELLALLKNTQPQSVASPLSAFDLMEIQSKQLSKDPVIANLQKLGGGIKSLLEPETPLDYLGMALPASKAIGKIGTKINFDDFKKLASKGNLKQAKSQKESLDSILKKEVPAQDFEFSDFDDLYESGKFTKNLKKAGLYVIDDNMGTVIAGRTKKDALRLANAKTPIDYGKSYGYTDADIAKFYVSKNKGNYKEAYKNYLEDL